MLVGGGLLLAACTSESPPDAAADSTDAASPTAVSQTDSIRSSPPKGEGKKGESKNDDRTVAEKLADARVRTSVKQALMRESGLRVFPFRPTVTDGHLILRGDVNTPDQYRRAERIADQVEGVTGVTNQLTMGGRPVTEDRLAERDSAGTDDADASVYHTVRRGETLWDIAREYRTSIEQIRRLNDLRSNALSPGQRIRVR